MILSVQCFIAVLVMVGEIYGASVNPGNNCYAGYQAALQEALDAKRECGEAAFADCCQVRRLKGWLPRILLKA